MPQNRFLKGFLNWLNKNKSIILLNLLHILYLNMGAALFMYTEYREVNRTKSEVWMQCKETFRTTNSSQKSQIFVNCEEKLCPEIFSDFSISINGTKICLSSKENTQESAQVCRPVEDTISHIEETCSKNLLSDEILIKYEHPWHYIEALYFSMTVATTIGYGHITPTTTEARIVCIFFALIGIPFTMILLSKSSSFFGEILFKIFTSRLNKEKQMSKFFIGLSSVIYIFIGFVIFVFVPAVVFMYTEGWTYFEGIYFGFITLTTIGFGDFYTGAQWDKSLQRTTSYQVGVIIWIMNGLGYWVMVANFIIRAVQSKKIAQLAKRATLMMKMMRKQSNIDPEYLKKNSRTSMAFMMQLSSAMAMQLGDNSTTENSPDQAENPLCGFTSLFLNSDQLKLGNGVNDQDSEVEHL